MRLHTVLPTLLAVGSGGLASDDSGIAGTGARQTSAVGTDCALPVELDATTNIWKNFTLHSHILWKRKVLQASESIADDGLHKKALVAAEQGVFFWAESQNDIEQLDEVIEGVPCDDVLGIVISTLGRKKCPTFGSPHYPNANTADPVSGDYQLLDQVIAKVKAHPNTAFAVIVEPEIIGTAALNPQILCEGLVNAYRRYAPDVLKAFDALPNVVTYLDAAHGGWFGWRDFHTAGANEIVNTWKNAGGESLGQFRGISLNVGSHNSWDMSPGEMFGDEDMTYDIENPARNEYRYLNIILDQQLPKVNGTNMPLNVIVDTSRNGIQGIRWQWDDWCNVDMAGFGDVPSASPDVYLEDDRLDAFVWAKEGGVSDGTDNAWGETFDQHCVRRDAVRDMPERGQWSQRYFEMLLKEWKPPSMR